MSVPDAFAIAMGSCRRRRCRETPNVTTTQSAAPPEVKVVCLAGESARLWNHVIYGTGTCVGMIEGYAALDMPGDPLPGLRSLVDRLTRVIKSLEEKNASPNSVTG